MEMVGTGSFELSGSEVVSDVVTVASSFFSLSVLLSLLPVFALQPARLAKSIQAAAEQHKKFLNPIFIRITSRKVLYLIYRYTRGKVAKLIEQDF